MNKTDLSKFNNDWYSPGRSKIIILLWLFINSIFIKNSLSLSSKFKVFLLRLYGAKIGQNVLLKPSISIKYPWKLSIGNNVWIGENTWIDNLEEVIIGDNVCISQGAMLLTGNHLYNKIGFDLITAKIILEEGVWIGAKSIVCPGVTCKSHSVLSVGSIATSDLEAYKIYKGNPALAIKDRIISS